MDRLAVKTIWECVKLAGGIAVVLFLAAGSFAYPQAWVYLFIVAGSFSAISFYLWHHDRDLLERRMKAGHGAEQEPSQKRIMIAATLAFPLPLVISALDYRWHGLSVMPGLVALGDLLVLLGFALVFATFRANSFAAATVSIADDHRVISTGPYRFVRHPMYTGVGVAMTGTALALGSWWGVPALAPIIAVLVWRLRDEERVLCEKLPGYAAYCTKVNARLIPFIW